jgi:hypothetical protein
MVVFMGHALLLCGIRLDVDDVPDVVVDQESRQFYGAMLCVLQSALDSSEQRQRTLEAPLEHVARTRPVTE